MSKTSDLEDINFDILLKRYVNKLEEVIEKLQDLRKTIDSHHHSCNLAKTAGTIVSSTGVAMIVGSVFSAPLTGASTLAVGAGGAVMSLTGGISNVVTDYVDYRTTTMIMNDIHEIVKSKEKFDEVLMKQLKHFAMVIEKLVETGMDYNSAVIITVKGLLRLFLSIDVKNMLIKRIIVRLRQTLTDIDYTTCPI